jgi:hypothetical protein
VATVTETSYATEETIVVDATETVTVTVAPSAGSTSSIPAPFTVTILPDKRDLPYPTWLPTSYVARQVSSACGCLSLSAASALTATATADAVTVTVRATVTETTTTTVYSTAVATATALPPVSYRGLIEVLDLDSGTSLGYLYNIGGGPGEVMQNLNQADTVNFTLPGGAAAGLQLRIDMESETPSVMALGQDGPQALEDT